MKKYKAYIYTCEKHATGEFVRSVGGMEKEGLVKLGHHMPHDHVLNCWVKGCQDHLNQVRLVEIAE